MSSSSTIIDTILHNEKMSDTDSFNLSKQCGALLYSGDESDNELARKILINLLDNWDKLPTAHHAIWTDLLESAGFYPYISQDKNKSNLLVSTAQLIRKEYHASRNLKNVYFHEEQKELANLIEEGKNVIVSAPTSFGKSLLIEDIVSSKRFKNMVIIQPTLALLDETRKKLKKYSDDYRIIVRTSQQLSKEKGNLFLLTAERVMEYRQLPKIDFFIIDEFYKLSAKRDDERSDVLNNAFHLLLKHDAQFYLLGPNIDGISEGFEEEYNAIFRKTNYSMVDNSIINVYEKYKNQFASKGPKQLKKQEVLFDLLLSLQDEQTMIYCSSPRRVRDLSVKFYTYLKEKALTFEDRDLSIIEWIAGNVSEKWSAINCLQSAIGMHDGALPKHINSSIINYFNEGKLKYLFCTSTIIEGVNTSAKNIVFFDDTKGLSKKIDYFDYANIKGRSGRLMVHYVGRIYNFNPPPPKDEIKIDIPFFEQNPVSDEVLIHLDESEIKSKDTEQYGRIKSIPKAEKGIIKDNGLLVSGQVNALERLKQGAKISPEFIFWKGMPTYGQLKHVVFLGWENFLRPGETTKPITKDQLVKITFDYGLNQDIGHLVKSQYTYFKTLSRYKDMNDDQVFDEAVRFAFQVMRHWFSYKIPKWLLSINELQKYVAALYGLNPGDYAFYASQIENDFVRSNLTILNEYGIPKSAIKKLEKRIAPELDENQVLDAIRMIVEKYPNDFIDYELEKLIEIF